MNPNNYASLKASKRLVKAGIVLRTNCFWYFNDKGNYDLNVRDAWTLDDGIPAPSMAEVWRELPYNSVLSMADDGESWVHVGDDPRKNLESIHRSFNPTDALIDLRIWVRKEASHA